ncbi:hypothetical protein L2E82_53170 [Cichorium intybus]|nr:hypothetical protein L2E82_53170 [Cichorium intybus]
MHQQCGGEHAVLAAPLLALRDKSTHMNGANSHVPSSLVWFREPPPPRPLLVFCVILSFFSVCRGKCLTFLHELLEEFPRVSIKQKEKPGWKHKLKERGKVERGEEV